jgi:hypothetical protein
VTAEQVVVLVLLVAAFAAGWIARGDGGKEAAAEEDAPAPRPGAGAATPATSAPATSAPTAATPATSAPATSAPTAAAARTAAPAGETDPPRRRLRRAARPAPSRPDPATDAARALSLASAAYETAVDRWLDEREEISPAGRAAVGELERAVQRLDHAAARLDEVDETLGDAAYDALDALRKAARHLAAFREGRALDAPTSRELERLEDEVARARAAFERAPT